MDRWIRRATKVSKRQSRMPKHGKNIGKVHKDVTLKRRNHPRNREEA